uniref:Uncharacterized protein n=1 Tax=Chromera velia CCMP2878 TaxID=1169474 RepID=A0A0K6S8Q1_9ALVE|eukprot:Cvel_5783.t1-p1 / transcript=Cvel_5783.t1 / gene=Cvel_5783 / organism=Chromera_velia_CCMP2878 / gene_product=hypothetical protein / transcript_product=hypothetical protein / location=Cvel_scaffold275:5351-6103(-) / protein_length=251 / sequence_SO=supercontig / SO=protein_coding / is_pseudo=false
MLTGAEDDQSNTLKSKSNVKQTAQKSSSPALVTRKPTLRQPPPTQAPFSSIQHHPQPAAVQQSGQTRSSIPARYPDYGERDEEGAEVSDELEEFPPTVPLRPAVADRERGGRQRERDLEGRGTSSLSSSSGRGAAVSVPVRGLRGESERERRGVVDPSATATDDVPSSVTHMTFASEPSSKHNFSVNMDRLTTDWLDVTELPPPLRNALTFVCLTTFPRDSRVTRLHLPAAPSSWSDGKSRDYCLVLGSFV